METTTPSSDRTIPPACEGELSRRQEDEALPEPAPSENGVPASYGHVDKGSRALTGIFVLALFYTIYFARIFLMPIVFALMLSILLHPLVRYLKKIKVPYAVGAAIVLLMVVSGIGAGVFYLSAPAAKWLDSGPQILDTLEFKLSEIKASLEKTRQATRQLEELTDIGGSQQRVEIAESSLAEKIFTRVQSFSSSAVVILVLNYFLLAFGWRILQGLSGSGQASQTDGKTFQIIVSIQEELSGYLLTVTIMNFLLGMFTAASMALLGLPNPVLWGVTAALLNYVPYLGAAVTLCIIGLVSLLTFDAWFRIILPPLVFFILTALEGQFVTPSIVGYRLTVNPLMVLISILFWGWMWGIAGAILGVPLLVAFMITAKNFKPLAGLSRTIS